MKRRPKNLAGQIIREYLREKGMTQTQLAKEIGLVPCQLIDYMQSRRIPNLRTATKITNYVKERLGCIIDSSDWLKPPMEKK